ncbi:hypothetical protein [Anaeromyxobacter terrae]|uniref:hypothetical protein n=1 Tax=Anaeromyxobacter terrae TaxID=2925406 RepID=UPI001F560B67|nr:hypothetical protein [Anaeromyxobacter sp. SG22]
MPAFLAATLPLLLAATIDVPAGTDLAAALARARPGDVVRLAEGEYRGGIELPAGVRLEGAGAGRTRVVAPEGQDALTASRTSGAAEVAALSLEAAAPRCAVRISAGTLRARDLRAAGGGCGARVSGGALEGTDLALDGDVGLLVDGGEAELRGGHLHGTLAGVTVHGGTATLRHLAINGPSREAGLTVAGGAARLEGVVIRWPGPAGIAVARGGRVEGTAVVVAGVSEEEGIPGACVQVRRGSLALSASTLLRCGGAAVEASGGEVRLSSVDAAGGAAGGIVLLDGATAVLDGNLVTGHGPALTLAGGARATARMNRWWADPVFWVDCGSGARLVLGDGEGARAPCGGSP